MSAIAVTIALFFLAPPGEWSGFGFPEFLYGPSPEVGLDRLHLWPSNLGEGDGE